MYVYLLQFAVLHVLEQANRKDSAAVRPLNTILQYPTYRLFISSHAIFLVHTFTKAIRQDWCRVQAVDNGGLAALTAGQMTSASLRGRSPLMPRPESEDFGICKIYDVNNTLIPCVSIGRWHTLCPSLVLRECVHRLAGQAEGILRKSLGLCNVLDIQVFLMLTLSCFIIAYSLQGSGRLFS